MKRICAATLGLMLLAQPAGAQDAKKDGKEEKPKWDVSNPPGPMKDVTIDVTSGTWLSLDVSPDGTEIVFDLLGDLYTIPITGGEAKALTSGIAWDMQPRYSPNGKWIAFTSDRGAGDNIWIMDRDGSNPRQVTKEDFRLLNQPDWSPDSQFIIARKHFTSTRSLGAGEMWLYHRSGGEGVQLTKRRTEQKDTGEPAFSPDGRYVYFSDDVTPGGVFEYSKDPNTELYAIQRLDRETGEIEKFVSGPGGSIRPTPSPDGKSLAFIRRVRYKSVLYVMDLESGREVPIYEGLDRDMQETWAIHGVYPAMSWTPDNKSVVFWADGGFHRIDVATKQVTPIPFHVKSSRKIQEAVRFPVEVAPEKFDVKMLRWAEASPDGSQVVYEALGKLWIRDLPNGTPRRLTRQNDHFELYPAWSRDGKSIVYTTWSDEEFGSIRTITPRGGEGRKVTEKPGHYVEPAFSPDGQTIVYRTVADGYLLPAVWARETGIYTIPAKGGEPTEIRHEGVLPHFGADSNRLYFMEHEPGETGQPTKRLLKSVELDGSDEHTHLRSALATEYAVSPDGKWIAWTERFKAHIAPFPATGQTVEIGPDMKALPVATVAKDAGEWIHWSGDGKRLWWSLGPELFSRELKEAFAFIDGAPEKLPDAPTQGIDIGFTHAYDVPKGRIAFTNARVITMRGSEVIEDGTILVNGNRIEAVGPAAEVTVPADAEVVDAKGKTVMPGLIDGHWHGSMGANEIIPQQSWVNYASLAFGVTTLHDPSNDTSEIFAASELAKAGEIVAPRIFSTGTILYGAAGSIAAKIESLEDAKSHLRRMKAAGAHSVKSYNQPRRDQRQQVIEAARELGVNVVPEGGSLFQHNMTMIVDGHTTIEHSLPVGRIYDDVRQLWDASGTAYNPTLVVAYGGNMGENYWYQSSPVWADPILTKYVPRRILDSRARRPVQVPEEELNHVQVASVAHELNQLGVPVVIGAHGQREGLGSHWEMWMLAQGGMPTIDALRAGTMNGAVALGYDRDLGSIEPGKLADLIVLDANPLEDIRNSVSIRYTVLNGRVYDTEMNQVLPTAVQHKPFWFQQEGGESWARDGHTLGHGHNHGH
ncbi:amidohydrolase family protein [Indioceanicola profundi]|uniref:amidohydrolase family protein n=1 Tax=Indioceanicola profundi TaxID=2220096 RepID=UPI000E6AB96C|nr:amidohydrolase family protein [Indioceanicola profundi]